VAALERGNRALVHELADHDGRHHPLPCRRTSDASVRS
jgi:hypothetical protein